MPKRSGHETHRLVRCLGQFALESLVFAGMEADVTSAMLTANAASLTRELTWFEEVLQCRIHLHFGQPSRYACIEDIAAPELSNMPSLFGVACWVRTNGWYCCWH
jgi:hypothetical protein